MDLYSFKTDSRIRPDPVTYLRGRVVNAVTGMPVSAEVVVSESGGGSFTSINLHPGEEGVFLVTLPPKRNCAFRSANRDISFIPRCSVLRNLLRFRYLSKGKSPSSRPSREIRRPLQHLFRHQRIQVAAWFRTRVAASPGLSPEESGTQGGDRRPYRQHGKCGIQPWAFGKTGRIGQALPSGTGNRGGEDLLKGYGQEQPVASNDTGEGRSKTGGRPSGSPNERDFRGWCVMLFS